MMETSKPNLRFFAGSATILLLIVVAGLWYAHWQSMQTSAALREAMMNQTMDIAATVNLSLAKQLTFTPNDTLNPAYLLISEQLTCIARLFPDRGIYTMKLINGEFRFGPQSYLQENPFYSLPGAVYNNPGQEDFDAFNNAEPQVFGHVRNEYGSFVSALTPIIDRRNREVIMLVGSNVPADQYLDVVKSAQKLPIVIMIVTLVLVITAMVNVYVPRSRPDYKRSKYRNIETALAGAFFLFLTFIVTTRFVTVERQRIHHLFSDKAAMLNGFLTEELVSMHYNTETLARFINSQEYVTNSEFAVFMHSSIQYSSAGGYIWAPRVPDENKERFVEAVRANEHPCFVIQDLLHDGSTLPAKVRNAYFPVLYAKPTGEFRDMIGIDLNSLPEIRDGLERVTKYGLMSAVGLSGNDRNGVMKNYIIVLSPVANTGSNTIIADGQMASDELLGVAVLVVDIQETLNSVRHRYKASQHYVVTGFYDLMADDSASLLSSYPPKKSLLLADFIMSDLNRGMVSYYFTPIFVFGHAYVAINHATPAFWAAHPLRNAWITGLTGLLVSVMVAAVVWFWRNRQYLLHDTLEERTRMLSERLREMRSLQEINKTLRQQANQAGTYQKCALHLLEGFQHPEMTSVHIRVRDKEYSAGQVISEGNDKIKIPLELSGRQIGEISVVTKMRFFDEDKNLATQTAQLLSMHLENIENQQLRIQTLETLRQNEASLQFAQMIANMGSWEYHVESGKVIWSENNYRILGFEPFALEPTAGLFEDMVHPDDKHIISETYKQATNDRQTINHELRIIKPDGEVIWLEAFTVAVFENRKPVTYRGVNIDITQRKKASEALLQSEEKFRLIAEHTADNITLMDMNMRITYTSPSIYNLRGFTVEEAVNHRIDQILTPESNRQIMHLYRQQMEMMTTGKEASGRTFTLEVEEYCKDGSTIWVELTASFIVDSQNQPIGIVAVSRDVTLRKMTEEALKAAKEKAEESDKLKTAFMNNISHEIRTPLNGIIGFGRIIAQYNLTQAERLTYLETLQRSTDRLINTVNDYMDISLIVSGSMKVNKGEYDLRQLIEKEFAKTKNEAEAKGLAAALDLASLPDSFLIETDKELLCKALQHLLNNAVKFTPAGRVSLKSGTENQKIVFEVSDTGVGINDDAKARIFESFSQEEISNTRRFEGSGLGLSIAWGIMKLLDGRIWFESEKGRGSVFYLEIPAGDMQEQVPETAPPAEAEETPRPLVLLAEDEESNYLYLQLILEKANCAVIHVTDGQQAVDECRRNQDIKLVLMDIKMPVLDGVEATRQIKSFRNDLPVVAVTAHALTGDKYHFLQSGCDDYLAKPVFEIDIINTLKKFKVI